MPTPGILVRVGGGLWRRAGASRTERESAGGLEEP